MAMNVKYISDANGNEIEVVVPIALWRALTSSPDVAQLLDGDAPADLSSRNSDENEHTPSTCIGTDEVTGMPVFITPPGSPTLTSEYVKMLEDDW